ncbi:MAG: 3-phosphoshikimate 1-carboxyvinyltransferase [Polyangiaceae bacterium]
MPSLVVHPIRRGLTGSVPLPADKSIAHRALIFAALANGTSRVVAGAKGDDNAATADAFRAMGVRIDEEGGALSVHGRGLFGLTAPAGAIDCGNSGTTMRLLAGVLAAQRFQATLVGDASLSRRPMERVARPLRLRGARIEGKIDPKRPGECTAPLTIGPLPEPLVLGGIEHELPVASAQVKSAILISGMFADGATYVREPVLSRDHTERMMSALGVPIRAMGPMAELDPSEWSGELPAFEIDVPGDLSAGAFLIAAAHLVPGSRVDLRNVGINPTRTGMLEVLRDMGGSFEVEARGVAMGEPIGLVRAGSSELSAARVGGEIVARAIDEVPILCGLAARARGVTVIADAAELRVKETDRIAAMAEVLRAFGVDCEERADGLAIEGKPDGALRAADIDSRGDHRIAMTAAVLGLVADGKCRVRDAGCIRTSFPKFVGTMRALGATIEVEET